MKQAVPGGGNKVIALLLLVVAGAAPAQGGQIDFSAVLDQEFVFNSNNGSAQKIQTTLVPRWDARLGEDSNVTAIGRIRFDQKSALGFSGNSAHSDVELRELYLDTEFAGAHWRLGKQQVVWGQADGLRVLDVINPLELREFILPEFEDHRIPLWTANIEWALNDNWVAQLLLIPDQTYDDLAERDGVFALRSPLLLPTVPVDAKVTLAAGEKPRRVLKDADAGARLSAFVKGWDLSLNYLYHYQDQPVLLQQYSDEQLIITPRYERTHLVGGSLSNVFGDFTLRSEAGYSSDRYFLSDMQSDHDGVQHGGEFSYVVGLDYQGWRDWFLSAQLFQSRVTDYSAAVMRDRTETSATLLVRRYLLNDLLEAEALFIRNNNRDDGVTQLSLEYEWRSEIRLKLGADIFYGTSAGLFGQFNENDRVSMGIEIGF